MKLNRIVKASRAIAQSTQLAIQQPASIETGALREDAGITKSVNPSRWGSGPKKGATLPTTFDEMLEIPKPIRCGKFTPGHEVHWIPVTRFAGERRLPATVRFEDGRILLYWFGPDAIFYNHELDRIRKVVELYGQANISFNPLRKLLYIKGKHNSSAVFYLAEEPLSDNC